MAVNARLRKLANSVNSQGQIVGLSGDCSFEDSTLRAVISEREGPVVDLNTLIPPNSGVQLRNATMINDRGEIAAVGWFPDGDHGPVLLIPCDNDPNEDIDGQNSSGCQNLVTHAHPRLDRTAVRKRLVPQFIPSRPQLFGRNWLVKSCCGDG
jgi:hypothetical protein